MQFIKAKKSGFGRTSGSTITAALSAVILGMSVAALADDVKHTQDTADIIKLSQAHVGISVMEAFIANSPTAYNPKVATGGHR